MGLFDKMFNKLNNKKTLDSLNEEKIVGQPSLIDVDEHIDLPEGEIVSFTEEILDTDSKVYVEKLKHNLEILIKKAKETGKVDKFMLIREDDFFPHDWEWRVLSKNTNLEKVCTPLSYELRKAYALEQSGITPYIEVMGIKVPNVSYEQTMQALSQTDKTVGSVLLPSRFRSTKHFTINTPLGVTGDYNFVHNNRDYIIIDDISNFLTSEYGYSVSYHDAYLDVSHESLPISENAVVLINDENYDRIMSDEEVANELKQRNVVRFKGDEDIAINMILTQMGALPSKIGTRYANYDKEIYDILDSSIKKLADENGLFFDKSHAGQLRPDGGHFSNYYDDKNKDYENAINKFIAFLREKFPGKEELFPEHLVLTESNSQEIVEKLGTTNLLEAINEYNELENKRVKQTLEEYKKDRQTITPEIHTQFIETIALINNFYKSDIDYETYNADETIQKFMQGETVNEQLKASKEVWDLLPKKQITPAEATKNALKQISRDTVNEVDKVEKLELNLENIKEGDTRDD